MSGILWVIIVGIVAGFITATIGAVVILFIWHRLVTAGVIPDPGRKL